MKHTLRLVLLLICCCLCVFCPLALLNNEPAVLSEESENMLGNLSKDDYRVYIDGVPTNVYAKYRPEESRIMVPAMQMIEALGGTVTWRSETIADVVIADKLYEFDLTRVHLHVPGSESNIFMKGPGSTERILPAERMERDAYVDNAVFEFTLWHLMYAHIDQIDHEQHTIQIVHESKR